MSKNEHIVINIRAECVKKTHHKGHIDTIGQNNTGGGTEDRSVWIIINKNITEVTI